MSSSAPKGIIMSSMIGEKAPDFNLKTSEGDDFKFNELELSLIHI